jgi:hypothetical protein
VNINPFFDLGRFWTILDAFEFLGKVLKKVFVSKTFARNYVEKETIIFNFQND